MPFKIFFQIKASLANLSGAPCLLLQQPLRHLELLSGSSLPRSEPSRREFKLLQKQWVSQLMLKQLSKALPKFGLMYCKQLKMFPHSSLVLVFVLAMPLAIRSPLLQAGSINYGAALSMVFLVFLVQLVELSLVHSLMSKV